VGTAKSPNAAHVQNGKTIFKWMQKSTDLEIALKPFLPEGSVELVCEKLREYPHHLVITPPRSTKLGDFKADSRTGRVELTVNGNLNPYAFLVTLMHELAHLITHKEHGWKVKPHGAEWKSAFKRTLGPFLRRAIFPEELQHTIHQYLQNPGATSCSDLSMSKALARYDRSSHPDICMVDDLKAGDAFVYGRQKQRFIKGAKVRTRIQCKCTDTGHLYLFHPLTKVKHLHT
jgi:SprT protein